MIKLFSFIQFHYSCVEIYSLLSEFGSFMSKSLLLLNYQSDRLVSSPVLLLVAHWNWWMNSMLHGPLFIIHLDPLSCRSDVTEPSGKSQKETRLDGKPTGGYKAPSSGRNCVLQPQNNTEPHQPLRWIQVLYYFSPNVHRYSVFFFVFFTIHIWQVEGKYLPYR